MKTLFQEIQKGYQDQFAFKKSTEIKSCVQLPGDASSRKYYRIATHTKDYILMKMEAFYDQGERLPFIAVQNHLKESGVDVPSIFDFDSKRGLILLEDLGDVTLLRKLENIDNKKSERILYQHAIDSLIHLQVHANKKKKGLEAFQLKFDHEKLFFEVNHTVENFYKIYLKRIFRSNDEKLLKKELSQICKYLANRPRVFTHRDFHSRNIMVCSKGEKINRLVMIDFQDARMGPVQYDLVSLLKDSYYQLEDSQISFLINYYKKQYEASFEGKKIKFNSEQFEYDFDLMSIQRNFKAIGSFAFVFNKRGDPSYLKFIGNTFENIRRTLLKYPKYSRLRELLFHYYYF